MVREEHSCVQGHTSRRTLGVWLGTHTLIPVLYGHGYLEGRDSGHWRGLVSSKAGNCYSAPDDCPAEIHAHW